VTLDPWSQVTRDRWFFAALGLSTVSVAWLLWPYASVLLFAATFAVVTWPLFERVLALAGGRRLTAAVVTALMMALGVFVPLSLVIYLFAVEAIGLVQAATETVALGALEAQVTAALAPGGPLDVIRPFLPTDLDLVATVVGPARSMALSLLQSVGQALPALLNAVVNGGINAVIFVATIISLYAEGPSLLRLLQRLSPLDDRYEARLFDVFREFAQNLVLGAVATAAIQGVIAAVGYEIAGAPRVLFFGTLTAVFSFFPLVGAMVIWVPLTAHVGAHHGWGWATFLALWSILFMGTADNVLKPLFMRGSSNLHPLLVFLAVFGGMAWMGLAGVFVGPVLMAFFAALFRIYETDYLGVPPPPAVEERPWVPAWLSARWKRRAEVSPPAPGP
jgi:predicted PurR-regulated permease PerM